jgi:hypothetical protein
MNAPADCPPSVASHIRRGTAGQDESENRQKREPSKSARPNRWSGLIGDALEPFPFRWNRNGAPDLVLTRFLYANRYPLCSKTL